MIISRLLNLKIAFLFSFLFFFTILKAQKIEVKGIVVNKDKRPIEGVFVFIDGRQNAAVYSDSLGHFTISGKLKQHIVLQRVGYKSLSVEIDSEDQILDLIMEPSAASLDEVVITATGTTMRKRAQGYTSTTISGNELSVTTPTTIAGALAGKVAGLEVSAVGGGVNPNYRLVLRGQRSITGNNQALIVMDGSIVPSEMLNNINPLDIENIQVLNGPSGVALYGSQASNGALVVTTKRGKAGPPVINILNSETAEHTAFNPKLQKEYGYGGDGYGIDENGDPVYSSIENEAYGPKFDGSTRPLGAALEDGSQLEVPYSYFKDRNKFWQVGVTSQTNFSISSADAKSSQLFSAQYLNTTGTTWLDNYKRAIVRLNGSRKFLDNLELTYQVSYTINRYNITSATSSVYDEFLNMPGNVPITEFKDWRNNKFANPNGYYNPWYANPYFEIENNRQYVDNDYLLSSISLKWAPAKWLTITSRSGFENRTFGAKYTTGKFTYTDYAKTISGGSKTDIVGSNSDENYGANQFTSYLYAEINKSIKDFTFYALFKGDLQSNYQKYTYASVSGLSDSSIFNLGNSLNYPSASSNFYNSRQLGATYQFRFGYKNYLFLETSGRNDWVSILDPSNRSFFYPAVNASFVATDAIPFLKKQEWLNVLKFRGGWSKVGQVNLSGYTYGAYALDATFGQANGYPYNGVAGYSVGGTIVQKGLKPEMTMQWEWGTDFTLFNSLIDGSVSYYTSKTNNQTIQTNISNTSGFQNYLTNAGETTSKGLETRLNITPINNKTWTVSLTGTYAYNDNKVKFLNGSLDLLTISSVNSTYSAAMPGYQFPAIYGTDYVRDDKGHVIVDSKTGLPSKSGYKYLGNANARNILGFTPTIRFKDFTITAVFEYRGGFKRYNGIGTDLDWSGMGIRTTRFNRQKFVFPNSVYLNSDGEYVKNTNITVDQGNGNGGFWTNDINMGVSSNYVTNGAYWKLRQLALSYNVPQSVLRKSKVIKSATVSLIGRNLFLWLPKDNLYTDPDYSNAGSDSNGVGLNGLSQTPPSRYYGGTISLTF